MAILTLLLIIPLTINNYYIDVLTITGIYAILALGLNIVVGLAGLLDLGYVAFYAVGAYSYGILNTQFGISFWPAILIGAILAAFAGMLLGMVTLRLRGDYLAIVTLGFGEVIRVLANNLDKPINLTNGPKGITPIQRPPLFFQPLLEDLGFSISTPALYSLYFYFLVLLVVTAVITATRRLDHSPIGRAWEAIREDELAAASMGVPFIRMKLLAFATGASFAGIVGVIFSAKQYFINPESFTFMESIGVLAMVILGGMGSIPGAILGATIVTVLNLEVLKGLSLWLNTLRNSGLVLSLPFVGDYALSQLPAQLEPAKYERLVFGIIIVIMVIFRPQGIWPARRRLGKVGRT